MRFIELFAGLGGLALAAPSDWTLVAAFDQDEAAAETHALNHGAPVVRANLASVGADALQRWGAEAWLASPPCQPFTRRGLRRDVDDPRCAGLLRLVELVPECRPRRVLVENVEGFHGSRAHALLVEALAAAGCEVLDVSSCPSRLGWPVRRPRQLTLGSTDGFAPEPEGDVARAEPAQAAPRVTAPTGERHAPQVAAPWAPPVAARLEEFLDERPDADLAVGVGERRRVADHLPMVGADGVAGTFTRSYGRAISGAGPVHWDADGPRFFSPEEILRLHGFPEGFRFPDALPRETRWRLAGNTVHVAAVRAVAERLAVASPLA